MVFSPTVALISITTMLLTLFSTSVRSFQLGGNINGRRSAAVIRSRISSSSSSTGSVRNAISSLMSMYSTAKEQQQGHEVRGNENVEIDEEEAELQRRFYEHQEKAPKLGFATDVRTLIQYNHGYAVMSTNSKS